VGGSPDAEPDVFVDVPHVHVGKLEIDVERLEAHLALHAQAGNLVNLVAGVHVGVDKVKIDLEDDTAGSAVEQVAEIGSEATRPGARSARSPPASATRPATLVTRSVGH
jgi:hypothetical protein